MSHHQKRRFYYAFENTLALSNRNRPMAPNFDNKRKILTTIRSELWQNKSEQRREVNQSNYFEMSTIHPWTPFIVFPYSILLTKSITTNLIVTWVCREIGINFVDQFDWHKHFLMDEYLACVAIISMRALKMSTFIALPSPSIQQEKK